MDALLDILRETTTQISYEDLAAIMDIQIQLYGLSQVMIMSLLMKLKI